MVSISVREAATLLNTREKQLRQELDRVIQPHPASPSKRRERRFGVRELAYFEILQSLRKQGINIDPEQRRELYTLLITRQHESEHWRLRDSTLSLQGDILVTMNLTTAWRSLFRDFRAYSRGLALVEKRNEVLGGEPVFRGTRIPVRQIVDLFRQGHSDEEIREDYPTLSEDALVYARIRALAGPGPGRPPSALKFKHV